MTEADPEITQLLHAWRDGEPGAEDKLMELVYAQMHRIAARHMRRERPDHTLRPTALVHEAYLRLVRSDIALQDRTHFMAIASLTMRRILVDHAKSNQRIKRGDGARKVSLEDWDGPQQTQMPDLLDLDRALTRLSQQDARCAKILEMVYFGGVVCEDVASFLDVSPATVNRSLRIGKAWLRRELDPNHEVHPEGSLRSSDQEIR